jgi:VWFA-related protein
MDLAKECAVRFCRGAWTAVGLIAVFAVQVSAWAQDGILTNLPGAGFGPEDAAVPTIQVYSRETVVDVTVADKDGRPVHGLTKADFSLLENGKPQSIRSFHEYGVAAPGAAPAPAPRKLPLNTYTNAQSVPGSGPLNILLLDVMNSSSTQWIAAKPAIIKYLKTMPQGTEVAIFSLSPIHRLHLLQEFTTDRALAAASVERLDAEWQRPPPMLIESTPWTYEALQQITAYVAGIKGRKNLMWFASAPPFYLLHDGGYSQPGPLPPDMTWMHQQMDLYDAMTAAQIAVSPIDINGVMIPPTDAKGLIPSAFIARSGTMFKMEKEAEDSGGTAHYNNNDAGMMLGEAIRDGANYYTLSYGNALTHDDGKYHSIEIKVNRVGVHLVYRKGFNGEKIRPVDATAGPLLTQTAMGKGLLPATQVIFNVQVQPSAEPKKAAGDASAKSARRALGAAGKVPVSYDTLFTMQASQITFATTPEELHTASIEFDLAAYNTEGKLVGLRSQSLKLKLTPIEYDEFMQTPFQFFLPIDLPTGEVTLRMGVFDAMAKKVGTLEISLTVGNKTAESKIGGTAQQ